MINYPYEYLNHYFPRTNRLNLASSLFDLCSKKCSGTLFIRTPHKGTAIFILKNGEITDLSLGLKRDLEAIKILRNDNFKSIVFLEGYSETMPYDAQVDCSQTLLTYLGFDLFVAKDKLAKTMCYLMA